MCSGNCSWTECKQDKNQLARKEGRRALQVLPRICSRQRCALPEGMLSPYCKICKCSVASCDRRRTGMLFCSACVPSEGHQPRGPSATQYRDPQGQLVAFPKKWAFEAKAVIGGGNLRSDPSR